MLKIKLLLLLSLLFGSTIKSQSLIQKFVNQTFVLSDSLKSPDGYYFGFVSFDLYEGSLLMINAKGLGGYGTNKPRIIIRGPVENGKEVLPTLKFNDETYDDENNAVYLINKTGSYIILIANGNIGKKGTIKTSIGLGRIDWIDNSEIFVTNNNTPLGLALAKLLRHAVFNFNLIKGEKRTGYVGRFYENTFDLPGANMISVYTDVEDYRNGAKYMMAQIVNRTIPKKTIDEKTIYNKGDSVIAIKRYDSLKKVILNALPSDFVLEKEERFHLLNEDKATKNGLRIIFSHKGNEKLIDPNNDFPDLVASKKMKIELSLELGDIISKIYLRIYSEVK